jgi:hypothetical protein
MTRIPALPRALGKHPADARRTDQLDGCVLCRERGVHMAEPVPIDGPEGFARDGFHAGPAGYRSWAEHLADHILMDENRTSVTMLDRSDLKRGNDDDHGETGERKLPEVAALAQSGKPQRLDNLDHHREYDEG